MVNFNKMVKGTDAVLNCIPVVSALNNAVQALYKLAHRVDAFNPVAPGLKTTIQIHILSKRPSDHWIESIPLIGNWIALKNLTASLRRGFRDDLLEAVFQKNQEIVHLSLGNQPLNDIGRAKSALKMAAAHSSPEIFQEILKHRSDWSADSLLEALKDCAGSTDDQVLNATRILDHWGAQGHVLDSEKACEGISAYINFSQNKRLALAERVFAILPNDIPFPHLQDILLCPLTEEHRIGLIAKSQKPSSSELKKYYQYVGNVRSLPNSSDPHRNTCFDTLNRLIDVAQLDPDEIASFIVITFIYDESAFTSSLIEKYENILSPESKIYVLRNHAPSDLEWVIQHACCSQSKSLKKPVPSDFHCDSEKRVHLFAFWLHRWKTDIPEAKANILYRNIHSLWMKSTHTNEKRESVLTGGSFYIREFQDLYAQMLNLLLEAFPGCDRYFPTNNCLLPFFPI